MWHAVQAGALIMLVYMLVSAVLDASRSAFSVAPPAYRSAPAAPTYAVPRAAVMTPGLVGSCQQILNGPFSAVSKPMFASWKALGDVYKIDIFLHRSDLKNSVTRSKDYLHFAQC